MSGPYYLHFWGSIRNDDLVERELGITSDDLWFETEAEREAVVGKLYALGKEHGRICALHRDNGPGTLRRVIANIVFRYGGKEYPCVYRSPFCGTGNDASTQFYFEGGNMACDCNRANLIGLPEMECGDTIDMVSFELGTEPAAATQDHSDDAVLSRGSPETNLSSPAGDIQQISPRGDNK